MCEMCEMQCGVKCVKCMKCLQMYGPLTVDPHLGEADWIQDPVNRDLRVGTTAPKTLPLSRLACKSRFTVMETLKSWFITTSPLKLGPQHKFGLWSHYGHGTHRPLIEYQTR